jgi:predicted acylesterase/phospholipase RssA
MASTKIDDLIKEVNSQIESNLSKKENNEILIVENFKKLNLLIEDLGLENPELYGYYKYQYHNKYSSFLFATNNADKANNHGKLSKIHEEYYIKIWEKKVKPEISLQHPDNDWYLVEKFFENDDKFDLYDDIFKKIESLNLIDHDIIQNLNDLKERLTTINKKKLNNFIEYTILDECSENLKFLIYNIINKLNNDTSSIKKSINENLQELEIVMMKEVYGIKIDFMQKVIVSSTPEKLLFNEQVVKTEENIRKCYRKLVRSFSPDTPQWINDENQALANKLTQIINNLRDDFLKQLDDHRLAIDDMDNYEKKGDDSWRRSRDIMFAMSKEWEKLKCFKKDDLENLNAKELENMRTKYILESYNLYRGACRIADKKNLVDKQIYLRGNMSLVLYSSGDYIEAQLYAIASIQFIFKNSNIISAKILANAKKILEKVKGITHEIEVTNQDNLNDELNGDVNNILAMVKVKDDNSSLNFIENEFSFNQKNMIQGTLNRYLGELALQRTISCDKSLVNYKTPEEFILKTKEKAKLYKTKGVTVGVLGVGSIGAGAGVLITTTTGAEILATLGLITGTSVASPLVAIGAIVGTSCILKTGYGVIQESRDLLKEPKIREKLNKIVSEAVIFHEIKEYGKFIDKLSEYYDNDECLLKLKKAQDTVNTLKITESLIKHGFRPDGIGYLLNLIGEALISGIVKIDGFTRSDLVSKAKDVYLGILNEKLVKEAEILDERITELRKKNLASKFNEISDTFKLKDYSWIAKEHIKDAEKMPFKTRLEEVRNIAKLNIAIIRIMNADKDDLEDAKNHIEDVRNSVKRNNIFTFKTNLRLDAIEDFFWIVSGQIICDEELNQPEIKYKKNENTEGYLVYLEENFKKAKNISEKVNIRIEIAKFNESKAQNKSNLLEGLEFWEYAKIDYQKALVLEKTNIEAGIGFSRCLLHLSEFSNVISFLENNKNLSNDSEYWLNCGISYRKRNNFHKADNFISEALKKDPRNTRALHERELISKLRNKDYKFDQKPKIDIKEDYFLNNQRINEKRRYKILSIDGGGVRGIIPALWLNEIERRTSKPISHLFNMVAGTSAGGIIAAGLTIPNIVARDPIYLGEQIIGYTDVLSSYEPRYTACKIFQLFKTQSKDIFNSNNSFFSYLNWFPREYISEKYTDNGRKTLFNDYFGNTQIKDALTDLIIPTYSENMGKQPYLFNSKDSERNTTTFLDVLMATSAAPTFFKSYQITGKGEFLDGGINLNNPAMRVYTESPGRNSEKTFVLSLGTGTYIPEPSNPDKYRGKLFWAMNFSNVALSAQEGNVDIELNNLLNNDYPKTFGNRYQRWQVFMEKSIALDAYDDESLNELIGMGKQYIEEEQDQFNKLMDILQDDD